MLDFIKPNCYFTLSDIDCAIIMLEQLQRLQTHIDQLKSRVTDLEQENDMLLQDKLEFEHNSGEQKKAKELRIIQQKQEIEQLNAQLSTVQAQYKQLGVDATALTNRYDSLEKNCNDLKTRFQELLEERNELQSTLEQLQYDYNQAQDTIKHLQSNNQHLHAKNQQARTELQTFIERLNKLGQPEEHHVQEIQQLKQDNEKLEQELKQ